MKTLKSNDKIKRLSLLFKRARKYAHELREWRVGCWWFDVSFKISHFFRSRKKCSDCNHEARNHYKSDPYNGERGCIVSWQCGGPDYDWDGCECKWTGRGPMPVYCKWCSHPKDEHEDYEGYSYCWNGKTFEQRIRYFKRKREK